MKLREGIETIIYDDDGKLPAKGTMDRMIKIFKQWALDMVGKDESSIGYADAGLTSDNLIRNDLRKTIRDRIERFN